MAVLTTYPRVADPFKAGEHSGLNFAYGVGIVRNDNVISRVAADVITLSDDTTNYVEVDSEGTISTNTTGYTSGMIPLYTITTASGAITEVQDDRSFFSVGGGGGGLEIYEKNLVYQGNVTTSNWLDETSISNV